MLQIIIERFARHSGMTGNLRCATFFTILEPTDAREVTSDAAAEMRNLKSLVKEAHEKTAIDESHRRYHQRKFPAEHAPPGHPHPCAPNL